MDNDNNYNNINADASGRRSRSRVPHRREQEQPLNGVDMAHIAESLEDSIAVYEHNNYTEKQTRSAYTKPEAPVREAFVPDSQAAAYDNVNAAYENRMPEAANRSSTATPERKPSGTVHTRSNEAKVRKSSSSPRHESPAYRQEARAEAKQKKPVVSETYDDYGEENEKPKKKHPVLKLMLLLFIGLLGFVGYKFITGQTGYYTVAVFGVDSRNGNLGKDALSDVNIIARIDRSSGEVKLVSMYRDTYTKINSDGKYHKLNEAYFKGGPEQAIWAVEHNTDVKIDDYATFNWKAVADTINILGGVDLEISDAEFKYINAFITETVNSTGIGSHQLEHAGMNHLDGVQAVAYARLRLMDTDYKRTERQRKVIGLALDKAKNADYSTLANIIMTVMPEISTSVTPDDLIPFAHGISKYYISETAGFPFDKQGQNVGKLDCVIPVTLESNAIKLHEFLYPGVPYTPSSELKSISDKIINDTGLTG